MLDCQAGCSSCSLLLLLRQSLRLAKNKPFATHLSQSGIDLLPGNDSGHCPKSGRPCARRFDLKERGRRPLRGRRLTCCALRGQWHELARECTGFAPPEGPLEHPSRARAGANACPAPCVSPEIGASPCAGRQARPLLHCSSASSPGRASHARPTQVMARGPGGGRRGGVASLQNARPPCSAARNTRGPTMGCAGPHADSPTLHSGFAFRTQLTPSHSLGFPSPLCVLCSGRSSSAAPACSLQTLFLEICDPT